MSELKPWLIQRSFKKNTPKLYGKGWWQIWKKQWTKAVESNLCPVWIQRTQNQVLNLSAFSTIFGINPTQFEENSFEASKEIFSWVSTELLQTNTNLLIRILSVCICSVLSHDLAVLTWSLPSPFLSSYLTVCHVATRSRPTNLPISTLSIC